MELPTAAPQSCLYETLSPLRLSFSGGGEQSPQPPQSPEVYSVFRNEISLSSLDPAAQSAPAPDFFSLHVEAEPERLEVSKSPAPPAWEAEPKTPAREAEFRSLEGVWFRGNSRIKSPMLQLHKEIVDFCRFLSPTAEEEALRKSAVESVFGVIKYIWPSCTVEVFGSFRTGLYLPTSDVDVVIIGSGINTPQMGLHALSKALSQKGIAKKIQVIAKARVPIIKFVEEKSGIEFDVSFDLQNGPAAADYIKGAVWDLPSLRPLCPILKVFLQQRRLNEVYSGGIGSYALITMIMVLLRIVHERRASWEHNLGVLLVQFFYFYGVKLNTADVGISRRGKGALFSKSDRGFITPNFKGGALISIEDPQAPENDIGKNSFNYSLVRSAFRMAFHTLTDENVITGLGPNRSILGTIIRPDPYLLKRKGGRNGEVTFKSLLPGAGEPVRQQPQKSGDGQDMFCNWQWENEEEPLPRGGDVYVPFNKASSSGKRKRKPSASTESDKKARSDRNERVPKPQVNGTAEKTPRKRRRKKIKADGIRLRV